MADVHKELDYKLREYPLVRYNMNNHSVFHEFLSKATTEQLEYCEDFFRDEVEIIWSNSKAGTAKTFTSVACAYADFLNKNKTMYFIIAPVSEDIGALPGSKWAKEAVYFGGLYDALLELNIFPERAIYEMAGDVAADVNDSTFNDCWIHAVSHVHLRGINIESTLVVEEAQNFKKNELKKVLTRFKSGSTAIVIGSSIQIDLKDEKKSGLVPYMEHFETYPGSRVHTLTQNFRSALSNHADEFKW